MPTVRLCALMDLPFRGGRLFKNADEHGRDVLVFKRAGGELVAYDAACPHAGALLRPENEIREVLTCTLHQWRFSVADGQAIGIPNCALERYAVRVEDGGVWVDLPEEPPRW